MNGFGNIMKQAQVMQKKIQDIKEKVEKSDFEGQAAGGLVKITINGKFDTKGIKLDKSVVSPDDIEMLEDVIIAAFNDAKSKADKAMETEVNNVTKEMGLPAGFKLPI